MTTMMVDLPIPPAHPDLLFKIIPDEAQRCKLLMMTIGLAMDDADLRGDSLAASQNEQLLYHIRYRYIKLANLVDPESLLYAMLYENEYPSMLFGNPLMTTYHINSIYKIMDDSILDGEIETTSTDSALSFFSDDEYPQFDDLTVEFAPVINNDDENPTVESAPVIDNPNDFATQLPECNETELQTDEVIDTNGDEELIPDPEEPIGSSPHDDEKPVKEVVVCPGFKKVIDDIESKYAARQGVIRPLKLLEKEEYEEITSLLSALNGSCTLVNALPRCDRAPDIDRMRRVFKISKMDAWIQALRWSARTRSVSR